MRWTCEMQIPIYGRRSIAGAGTVEKLCAADVALQNAGMGNELQAHCLSPAFHLDATDLHMRNADATQMLRQIPV
ncbi:hypothetical protein HAX54_034177 [Datura stramonium]|uniref:Uncharacterized protein n=1 Tax=Datura stramonium TaxID=4076 RepID=A0ABS8SEX4_DATST|nr:hypothetical protein [Datura stramonium]